MLETSQDLFYVVLSFCVLWLTIFLCWALYYVIRLLKQTNDFIVDVKTRIATVHSLFNSLKTKIIGEGLKGLFALISRVREDKKEKTKTKSK